MSLHPLHYEDLKKSGLTDKTIEVAQIESVPLDLINKKLGFDHPDLTSCYEIPYDNTFSRFRLFYMGNSSVRRPKYTQRKGRGNRLYIPPDTRPLLSNLKIPLYITEGEKKSLKATQEGLCCVAVSGLWNWSNGNKELIPDFNLIPLKSREIYIVPDNDCLFPDKHDYRKNLRQAVFQLADKLEEKGAKVYLVILPQGDLKGFDDYLCNHTIEEFKLLPIVEVKSLAAKSYATILTPHTEVTVDYDLIPPCLFPFYIFPQNFLTIIKKISDSLHVEPEVIASVMLTITSGALGNTIRVSPKYSYEVAPFIWLIVIARSGYGKSPVIQTLLKYVKKLQAAAYEDYQFKLVEYEKKLKKAKQDPKTEIPEKPKLRHFFVSDCTVEALSNVFDGDGRGVIVYQDEIAGLILGFDQYKGKGNDRQHYLELFNCDSWKIDRKSGIKFIHNTGAAIIGGIQPKIMPKVFKTDSFDDGLLARFLLLNAENRPLKFSRHAITDSDISHWVNLLNWCYEIPLIQDNTGFIRSKTLILSDKALDLWEQFYNDYGSRMCFLSDRAEIFIPKLTAYYSLKFAGILHCIKAFNKGTTINSVIDEMTIQHAIELTKYFAGQAIKALKLYEQPEDALNELQKRLVKTLYVLQNEVKGGKLPLSRITETFNEGLPELARHTPEKIKGMFGKLGLTTAKSTGNYSYLIWEPHLIKNLFSKTTVTTVTNGDQNNDKEVTEVTEVTVELGNEIDLTGEGVEIY